jgi:hypothetical protein
MDPASTIDFAQERRLARSASGRATNKKEN